MGNHSSYPIPDKLLTFREYVAWLDENIEAIRDGGFKKIHKASLFKILTMAYHKVIFGNFKSGMVTECNEEGVALNRPEFSAWDLVSPAVDTDTSIKKWKEAETRVLFDGWKWKGKGTNSSEGDILMENKAVKYGNINFFLYAEHNKRTIERMMEYLDLVPNENFWREVKLIK